MCQLRERCRACNLPASIRKNWKRFSAYRLRIGCTIIGRRRVSGSTLVQGEQEPEVETGFINECILCVLEATRLLRTATSPSGRHI